MGEAGVEPGGRFVPVWDTDLWVVERGDPAAFPVLVLHGGPGFDHHEFADYLDPLAARFRLLLVDQRAQGRSKPARPDTWTIEQMAHDVVSLAQSLALERYAVLGHSFGAMVALQNAVDFPGQAAATVVSSGVPSARWFADVERQLEAFEPAGLRERIAASWAREEHVETAGEMARLWVDQAPFHFADPLDPRIEDYNRRAAGARYAPEVLQHFARSAYGGLDVEDRLEEIPQPVLVLTGRHDRACSVEASELMASRIPNAELVVFEDSGHMTFVEEQDAYLEVAREFLTRLS